MVTEPGHRLMTAMKNLSPNEGKIEGDFRGERLTSLRWMVSDLKEGFCFQEPVGSLVMSRSLGFEGKVDHFVIRELPTSCDQLLRPHLPHTFLDTAGSWRCWDPTLGGPSHFGSVTQSQTLLESPVLLLKMPATLGGWLCEQDAGDSRVGQGIYKSRGQMLSRGERAGCEQALCLVLSF